MLGGFTANGCAHRELAHAGLGVSEQQTSQIGARNEQHCPDGSA